MVRVCVLRGLGINADEELVTAFGMAPARPMPVHVNDLLDRPALLDDADIAGDVDDAPLPADAFAVQDVEFGFQSGLFPEIYQIGLGFHAFDAIFKLTEFHDSLAAVDAPKSVLRPNFALGMNVPLNQHSLIVAR